MSSLLATLRPTGDLGDQSNGTLERIGGLAGVFSSAWASGLSPVASGTIERIDFFVRAQPWANDQGPLDPTLSLRFREGSGGSVRTAGSEFLSLGTGDLVDLGPFSVATAQSGSAWDWITAATIQIRIDVSVNDDTTQIQSGADIFEVWAEVWGVSAGAPLSPSRSTASGVVGSASGTGGMDRTISGGGLMAKALGSGRIDEVR